MRINNANAGHLATVGTWKWSPHAVGYYLNTTFFDFAQTLHDQQVVMAVNPLTCEPVPAAGLLRPPCRRSNK
jgi:hypothetical protein